MTSLQPFQPTPSICPVCEVGTSFNAVRNYAKEREAFSLYECSACCVQFWVPFRNPGAGWYEERGDYAIQEAILSTVEREYHKKVLALGSSEFRGKKVLDVGCGTGEFLAALKERGCEVWGVDFDHTAVRIAKQRFGLERVQALSLEDFFGQKNLPLFDLITCFEVVEHVDNPTSLLSHIHGALQQEGKAFLSTPSRERTWADKNVWDYPPNHVTRWSQEALLRAAQRAGFRVVTVEYVDKFRMLLESVQGSLQTGLVKKTARSFGPGWWIVFKTKVVRQLGVVKAYGIGFIPAYGLWIYGKLTAKRNGSMLVELAKA